MITVSSYQMTTSSKINEVRLLSNKSVSNLMRFASLALLRINRKQPKTGYALEIIKPAIKYPNDCHSRAGGNPGGYWMPPYQVRGRLIKSGMTEFVPLIAGLIRKRGCACATVQSI
jgi:hypothetical protein